MTAIWDEIDWGEQLEDNLISESLQEEEISFEERMGLFNYTEELERILNPTTDETDALFEDWNLQSVKRVLRKLEESKEIPLGNLNGEEVKYNTCGVPLTDNTIEVKFGEYSTKGLIDTGSFVSLVSMKQFTEISESYHDFCPVTGKREGAKIFPYSQKMTFQTLTPELNLVGVGFTVIKARIGNCVFDTMLHIISRMNRDLILGRDFMTCSRMTISYETNMVVVREVGHVYSVYDVQLMPGDEVITSKKMLQDLSKRYGTNLQIPGYSEKSPKIAIADSEVTDPVPRIRDNMLQELSQILEFNRSLPLQDLDGVTHTDKEYWDAINQIDLDESVLTLKGREELFDEIFSQRGALAIGPQIGALKNFRFTIKMKSDKVFNKESYRMNAVTKTIMMEKINELVRNEVAKPYVSEYSSPALLIKKPSSKGEKNPWKAKYRLVIDLREMNDNAIHLQYSLPIIHEVITELNPSKYCYFSLLDVSDAFYQIVLHPDSYKYTTFKMPGVGSYCLTRLPQGYLGGPSTFQAVIENIFPHEIRPFLTCYIDDRERG